MQVHIRGRELIFLGGGEGVGLKDVYAHPGGVRGGMFKGRTAERMRLVKGG